MLAVGILSLLVAIPGAILATRELLARRSGEREARCSERDDRASRGQVCVATIQIDDRIYHLMPGRGRGTAPYLGHRSSAR
jgi:hypothetical protein